MALIFFLASTFLCVSQVLANVEVGAYQTLWLWNAYRMDSQTAHPTMALDCTPKTNGICLFDDFLRYIDIKTKHDYVDENGNKRTDFRSWEGHTSVGTNLDPDVESTVNELKNQGVAGDPASRYQNLPDNHKLFPELPSRSTFSDVHTRVMNAVQAARIELGADHVDKQVQASKKCWAAIHSGRIKDQASSMVPLFKNDIVKRNIMTEAQIPMKTMPAPDGTSYQVVDTQKVIDNGSFGSNPGAQQRKMAAVTNFKSQFDTDSIPGVKTSNNGKNHAASVSVAQELESRINDPTAC